MYYLSEPQFPHPDIWDEEGKGKPSGLCVVLAGDALPAGL